MPSKRIAVIGAGPIGLEAALYGVRLGHDVHVFERGAVGQNMRAWGHVRLFSPTRLNRSSLAAATLEGAGIAIPGPATHLTGAEHAEALLEPLARSEPLRGRIREHTAVRHVGRERIGKSDLVGGPRERFPFRLLLEGPAGEEIANADVVLDCSGTYGSRNWLGSGNLPALGERALRSRISYLLEDIAGRARSEYSGRRVLLVGSGMSAATALDALIRLERTRVLWISRDDRDPPYVAIPDDPLPERARLARLGNDLAGGSNPDVQFRRGTTVEALAKDGGGFAARLRATGADADDVVHVDRIVAHVGYSPDNTLYRELQVHECYATLGPMKLAAALSGETSGDCLAQASHGPETLRNPEPGFFVVGAKSYGKNPNFLIHLGLEQVREVYTLIESRPELNLYAA
jgi:thioredoxin reductase